MDKDKLEIVKSLQESVELMKIDDIEQSPESSSETFQCDCCGQTRILAGSMIYDDFLLCNECVLMAEVSFALKKIENIQQLIEMMEEKRFENIYNSVFIDKSHSTAQN